MEIKYKKCTKCGEEKEVSEFHKMKGCKYGVRNTCKNCMKEYQKEYQKENADRLKECQKEYQISLSDGYIITQLRNRNPNLTTEQIRANPELIRLKRLAIQYYREHLKEIKK